MSRPGDYRLILPEGWFRIDLEPGTREKSIAALVERQFRGADSAPHLKQEARHKLLATADDAFRNGGIELYVSLQSAAGFPLSAALVVTLTPPYESDQVVVAGTRLAETLRGAGRHATVIDLPVGQAVRVRSFDPPITNLEIHIPVPSSSAYLLLSFSTPLAPLADALVGMFDAIAGTLRWIP